MADRSGETIEGYRLLRYLGGGAFGDVYLAEDVKKSIPLCLVSKTGRGKPPHRPSSASPAPTGTNGISATKVVSGCNSRPYTGMVMGNTVCTVLCPGRMMVRLICQTPLIEKAAFFGKVAM